MWALVLLGCGLDLGARSAGAHADRCGDCHVAEAAAFRNSRHARAATSPTFAALRADAEAAWQGAALCDSCHRPEGDEGLTCLTCHAAAGSEGMGAGALIHDPEGPVRAAGPAPLAPHATVRSAFLSDSRLCATCHQVEGPAGFDEPVFDHWRSGPAAAEGIGCADCHMSATPGVAGERSTHAFEGLETAPATLLEAAIALDLPDPYTLEIRELSGAHRVPDGMSAIRVLEVHAWQGERQVHVEPLHGLLRRDGEPEHHPVRADEVVPRGLRPGERRRIALAEPADRACVRFIGRSPLLARELGLARPEATELFCIRIGSE